MNLFFRETTPSSIFDNPGFKVFIVFFLSLVGRGESVKAQSEIGTALDAPELEWVNDGHWLPQTEVTNDGEDALASAPLDNKGSAILGLTVSGPAIGSFWWKVSSEEDFDFLSLVIDGEVERRISGEVDWSQVEFEIPSGSHEIHWIYEEDNFDASGADRAWIDSFELSSDSQATKPPTLSIARGGVRGVVISWREADAVGYSLEASPFPHFGWSPVPKEQIAYNEATERESFTLNDAGHHLFFRPCQTCGVREIGPMQVVAI